MFYKIGKILKINRTFDEKFIVKFLFKCFLGFMDSVKKSKDDTIPIKDYKKILFNILFLAVNLDKRSVGLEYMFIFYFLNMPY